MFNSVVVEDERGCLNECESYFYLRDAIAATVPVKRDLCEKKNKTKDRIFEAKNTQVNLIS